MTLSTLDTLTETMLDAGQIFSGTNTGTMVKGYAKSTAYTPKMNPEYVFHDHIRDLVVWFIAPPSPMYVCGPCGSGKTSSICQLAARLNYPVFEVTGHNRLEFQDLVGHHSVQNGTMTFEYGPLALAMRYGGILLINELDLLEPSTATGFNSILDGQPLCIPENGGEIIVPHPMFRFIATANTNGGSDTTGLYQGTLRMNMALMDRFTVCEVGYPKPETEKELLEKTAPSLPEMIRAKMVEYANEVRRLFMEGTEHGYGANAIEVTFSTRTLIRWADLTLRYYPLTKQGIQPISYALDRSLGFRASRETRAMLHELVQRFFPAEYDDGVFFAAPTAQTPSVKLIDQELGSLARTVQGNPQHLLSLPSLPCISLHAPSTSGGKYWKATAMDSGLRLQWGKLGVTGASKHIGLDDCAQNNPVLELKNRTLDKLSRGYDLIPNETLLP